MMFGGYIGSLFILTCSMLVSAKTHSTVLPAAIPYILLFLPSFLSGFSVLSDILGILPDQLLQMNMVVKYFNLYQVGKSVVGAVPVVMVLYFVLCVATVPILYGIYKKAQ